MIEISTLSTIISDAFPRAFEQSVTRNANFFNLLRKVGYSNAKGPQWEPRLIGHSNAGTIATEGGAYRSSSQSTTAKASLPWAVYNVTLDMSGDAVAQIQASDTNAIARIVEEKVEDATEGLAEVMNTHLMGGDSTPARGFVGINAAFAAVGTYAGLSRSTYPNWATYVNANGGTPRAVTMALLEATSNYLINTLQGKWFVGLTSPDQEQTIANFTTGAPSQSLQIANGQTVNTISLGAGDVKQPLVPRVWVNGNPIVKLQGYTAGQVDFVDPSKLHIEVLEDTTGLTGTGGPAKVQFEKVQGADKYIWSMILRAQLVARSPRLGAAVLDDLS